jgi:cation diffusion facilitator family transporter
MLDDVTRSHTMRTRHQQVNQVLIITLAFNLIVALGKILVGLASGALAILADGFHSLGDAAGNLVGLLVNRVASQPPDDDHPYGHRRFESAGALVIGVLLAVTAWEVLQGVAVSLWSDAAPVTVNHLTLAVLVGTLIVNLFISHYQTRMGHQLRSTLLLADAENTRSDVYVTLSVLFSSIMAMWGIVWIDTVVALIVAALIVRAAFRILTQSGGVLVDTAPYTPDTLQTYVTFVPQVTEVARVRSRGSRDAAHIDVDVLVAPTLTTAETAEIAERIRCELCRQVHARGGGVAEVEVHFAPIPTTAA